MADLTPEQLWQLRVSQREANKRAQELLAQEMRLEVPKKPNGNGAHGSLHDLPPLPPVEAYEDSEPTDAPRETTGTVQLPDAPAQPGPIPWHELRGLQPPARVWWVQDWLTPGATLLAGAGGAGKSLVTQALLTALALGKDYLAPITVPRSSLLWACEDDREELWRRQIALSDYFGTDLGGLGGLHVVPRAGHDNTLLTAPYGVATPTPLLARLAEQVNDLNVDVLALDNVRQCFAGNENSGHDPTQFVNSLLGLVTGRPFAVLLLHHTSKSTGSEFAGNMAWENAVRSRWYLGPKLPDQKDEDIGEEPDPGLRYLCRRKSNYSGTDYVKLAWTDGVFRPEAVQALTGSAKMTEFAEQAVLYAVREARNAGIRVCRAPNSPASLLTFMRQAQCGAGIPSHYIKAAVTNLLLAGRIKEAETSRDGKRRAVLGLVPGDDDTLPSKPL